MGNSYISIRGEMMRKQVPIAHSHPLGSALPRSLSLTLDAPALSSLPPLTCTVPPLCSRGVWVMFTRLRMEGTGGGIDTEVEHILSTVSQGTQYNWSCNW